MPEEGQPLRSSITKTWPAMSGKDTPDHIFIDIDSKGLIDLLWIRGQPNRGLRRFNSTIAWMSSADGPLGPGLPLLPAEYSSRYFRC